MIRDMKEMFALPSEEEGGKPQYDVDYKAGFVAAMKTIAKKRAAGDVVGSYGWPNISISDGKLGFLRASRKHGITWLDGYGDAIDIDRGYASPKKFAIARRLGLIS